MNERGPGRSGVVGVSTPRTEFAARSLPCSPHLPCPSPLLGPPPVRHLGLLHSAIPGPLPACCPTLPRPGRPGSGYQEWTTALAPHHSPGAQTTGLSCFRLSPPSQALSRPPDTGLPRCSTCTAGFCVGCFPGLALVGPRSAPPRALWPGTLAPSSFHLHTLSSRACTCTPLRSFTLVAAATVYNSPLLSFWEPLPPPPPEAPPRHRPTVPLHHRCTAQPPPTTTLTTTCSATDARRHTLQLGRHHLHRHHPTFPSTLSLPPPSPPSTHRLHRRTTSTAARRFALFLDCSRFFAHPSPRFPIVYLRSLSGLRCRLTQRLVAGIQLRRRRMGPSKGEMMLGQNVPCAVPCAT